MKKTFLKSTKFKVLATVALIAIVTTGFAYNYAMRTNKDKAFLPEEIAQLQTNKIAAHYDLSHDQVNKVKAINFTYAKKMEDLKIQQKGSAGLESKMAELRVERENMIKAVLNANQLAIWNFAEKNRPARADKLMDN